MGEYDGQSNENYRFGGRMEFHADGDHKIKGYIGGTGRNAVQLGRVHDALHVSFLFVPGNCHIQSIDLIFMVPPSRVYNREYLYQWIYV